MRRVLADAAGSTILALAAAFWVGPLVRSPPAPVPVSSFGHSGCECVCRCEVAEPSSGWGTWIPDARAGRARPDWLGTRQVCVFEPEAPSFAEIRAGRAHARPKFRTAPGVDLGPVALHLRNTPYAGDPPDFPKRCSSRLLRHSLCHNLRSRVTCGSGS